MNNSLNLMQARLSARVGQFQQDKMIKDKKETLDRVVKYSYQGAKVQELGSDTIAYALINPNKVKQDYDDKIISIGYEYNYTPGTIFDWVNTGTKWLIYLQDLTELAYFKGDIRKCNYEIRWKNKDNKLCSTFVALTGPKETNLNSSVKEGISLDVPNNTLYFMVPNNPDTAEYFTRYQEFYLNNQCWRIEAIDSISAPGIIEVNAVEYYSNKDTDNIEQGIVDILEPIVPEPATTEINGDVFIKPKKVYDYSYEGKGAEDFEWFWDDKLPVIAVRKTADGEWKQIQERPLIDQPIHLKWTASYNGQFILNFGKKNNTEPNNNLQKTIVVESLF